MQINTQQEEYLNQLKVALTKKSPKEAIDYIKNNLDESMSLEDVLTAIFTGYTLPNGRIRCGFTMVRINGKRGSDYSFENGSYIFRPFMVDIEEELVSCMACGMHKFKDIRFATEQENTMFERFFIL